MKLLYATSAVYPSTLANRLQTLAMAKEFHNLLGDHFLLGVRSFQNPPRDLPVVEVSGKRSLGVALSYLRRIQREKITHVFCREDRLFFFLLAGIRLLRLPVHCFLELHAVQDSVRFWWSVRHADGIIVVAKGIQEYIAQRTANHPKILIASGAVDLARFDALPSRAEARRTLGWSETEKIIAYVGSFGFIAPWAYNPWKGADVLLDAAKRLPAYTFVFAGGEPAEVAEVRARFPQKNIVLLGQRTPAEIPRILRAADLLVLPNKSGYAVSEQYTSPLKLFEYMASGTPIVASDLPSIRAILTEEACFFATPNDSIALTVAISRALEDPLMAERHAAHARSLVAENTWGARARAVLNFLS